MKFLIIIIFPLTLFGQVHHWESIVLAENTCQYFIGQEEPASEWKDLGFEATDWLQGAGGVGYGDNDDGTTVEPSLSVYLRYEFSIENLENILGSIMSADYDDAFVAYLNGQEIFRNNIEGQPPIYSDQALTDHEAALYQGSPPESFTFGGEQLSLLREGDNVLALQVHNYTGTNSSDLTSNFYLHVGISEGGSFYQPVPLWFEVPIGSFMTPLPIMIIEAGEFIPDEPKIDAALSVVWNGEGNLNSSDAIDFDLQTNIAIERRGQSSLFFFPKHGFGFETRDEDGNDMDVAILGMPEEEDWILHGPYSDKTLMRNVLAMEIANNTDSYNSRTQFVELIIDGDYQGIYVLMEKIKRDKSRLDIAKLNPEDVSGDEVTGGYVFKIDKDEPDWFSNFTLEERNDFLGFQYVSPNRDNIVMSQREYINSYMDSFERALISPVFVSGGKRYDAFIDLESFADHLLIKELSKDVDAYRISSYYYKEKESKGGKLYAGPVWDFNIAFSNVDYCEGNSAEGWMYDINCDSGIPFWWRRMLEDEVFRDVLQCRWNILKETVFNTDTIFSMIDQNVDILTPALDRNFQKWPVLDVYVWPNSAVRNTYENEVNALKSFIEDRLSWMSDQLDQTCEVVSTQNDFITSKIKVFPNPSRGDITIEFPYIVDDQAVMSITSAVGKVCYTEIHSFSGSDYVLDVDLVEGIYILNIASDAFSFRHKIVIEN